MKPSFASRAVIWLSACWVCGARRAISAIVMPGLALTFSSRPRPESVTGLSASAASPSILLSGEDTAGRYTLIDMHVPPGGGPPPHRHDFEEMFTVLEGQIEITFRGATSVAGGGET
jgi:quercetin dioxygenase-like cupin family protein